MPGQRPQPLRVRERRLPAEPGALRDPGGGVGGRPPRAQHRPDVAEERAERREAEPEVDEDEPRGEVVVGRRVADRGGDEDEDEQGERGGAEEDPKRSAPHDRFEPRHRPAAACLGQEGPLPERPEGEEGGHEDDGGAPVEEPPGDGQVSDPAEPVGERQCQISRRQGRTSSSAIRTTRSSNSASNTPGWVRTELDTRRLPGCDVSEEVVTVQVDVVGDVAADDEEDLVALLDLRVLHAADGLSVPHDDDDALRRGRSGLGGGRGPPPSSFPRWSPPRSSPRRW